jgi:hypothetical protein
MVGVACLASATTANVMHLRQKELKLRVRARIPNVMLMRDPHWKGFTGIITKIEIRHHGTELESEWVTVTSNELGWHNEVTVHAELVELC